MIFLLSLINAAYIIDMTGPLNYSFVLTAGHYTVTCYGAQGGYSYNNGKLSHMGGRGAFVNGTMSVTGGGTKFWAYIGGKGEQGENGPNAGGFNGGGNGGEDTEVITAKEGPGGGGGATDLRIDDNSNNSRIMVAAGGSGGSCECQGAPGGNLYGYYAYDNNYFVPDITVGQNTNQNTLNGGDGVKSTYCPGSGGGGGWKGGPSSGTDAEIDSISYMAVARSGSSYISGYAGCKNNSKMTFRNGVMIIGVNEGNGRITIEKLFNCSKGCSSCTSASVCIKCLSNYFLDGTKCVSTCPPGTFGQTPNCKKCQTPCSECADTATSCTACVDGYSLSNGQCMQFCPNSTTNINGRCEPCTPPCDSCIGSKENCLTCIDKYYLYNNKCFPSCPSGTAKSGGACEDCSPFCATCNESPSDCTSCIENYYLHNGKCLASCPDGTVEIGGQCSDCKGSCATCSGSPDYCTTCKDGFYLTNNKCYAACPDGTSVSGIACV